MFRPVRVSLGCYVLLAVLSVPASAMPRGRLAPRGIQSWARTTAVRPSLARRRDSAGVPLDADGVGRPGPLCQPRRDILTYHQGALVLEPDVFLIFWGSEWQSDPEHVAAQASLLTLFQEVGGSSYACAWNEYGVSGMLFGAGTLHNPPFEIVASAPPSPLSDAVIHERISMEVAAGRAPARTDNAVYIVVPPRGVAVDLGDGSTGCGGTNFVFCAYHDSFVLQAQPRTPIRYAVLPFPCSTDAASCFVDSRQDAGRALQVAGSHELAELVTDPDAPPVGSGGWFSNRTGLENADLCETDACVADVTSGGESFAVNSLWSNLAKGCVASVPCAPTIECTDPAPGSCIPGSGQNTACIVEWLVSPNLTEQGATGVPGKTVSCTDGQPFCDADGQANGQCTFRVATCLNNDDPRLPCSPASISSVQLLQPAPTSSKASARAAAATILDALREVDPAVTGTVSGARLTYSGPSTTHNACSGFFDLTVPVKTTGARTLQGVQTIRLSAKTTIGTARSGLTLTCIPASP